MYNAINTNANAFKIIANTNTKGGRKKCIET